VARTPALALLDPGPLESPGADPLLLAERPFRARLLLRGRAPALAAALAAVDLAGAERVGEVARAGGRRALRLGPDRLALLDAPGAETALLAALEPVLGARGGAVVDLGEAMTTLALEGPEAAVRATLAEGCPLDLDARAFPPGRCAASLYGKVAVWLEAVEAEVGRLRVELQVDRSLAEHLARHLALAGREHGFRLERRADAA
jgi:sarcosine oxidase subunit gamma